jgi:DNA-binding MarR family transcriptional regulator
MTRKEQEQFIFGSISLLANRLQAAGDGVMKEITLKQFLLLIVIENIDKDDPSLNDIAIEMGSTRQNIKKMIDILAAKGFVKVTRLENDKRNLSVSLTERAYTFFKKYDKAGNEFLGKLFEDISEENMKILYETFTKLFENISGLEGNNE